MPKGFDMSADQIEREVRQQMQRSGGGNSSLHLKDSKLPMFEPKSEGRYVFDIIPYLVTATNNPYNKQDDWAWHRLYFAHRSIGAEESMILCPTTFPGQKCPICEEQNRAWKNEDRDTAKLIRKKDRALLNIKLISCPKTDENMAKNVGQVMLFDMSVHLFLNKFSADWTMLCDEGNDEIRWFPHIEKGMSVAAGFSQKTFENNKFYECTRVDFIERIKPLPKTILQKVEDLDLILNFMDYKKVNNIFMGDNIDMNEPSTHETTDVSFESESDEITEPEETEEMTEVIEPPAVKPRTKSKSTPTPPDDEVTAPDELALGIGDKVNGVIAGESYPGKVIEVLDEDAGVKILFDDGDTYDLPLEEVELVERAETPKTTPKTTAKGTKPKTTAKSTKPKTTAKSTPKSKDDPVEPPCPFSEGQVVQAVFEGDGNYYEAKVLTTDAKRKICQVQYSDDESIALVTFDNIKVPEKTKAKGTTTSAPKAQDDRCIAPGGTFGVDFDDYGECNQCPIYAECGTEKMEKTGKL